MNKWKVGFGVSWIINIALIAIGSFILAVNSISSGHWQENCHIVAEDMDYVSSAIRDWAPNINEFDHTLKEVNAGHWVNENYNFISLQIVNVLFDEEGNFNRIETYAD